MAVFLPEIKSVILKQELKGSQNHLVDGTYSSHPGGSDDKRIHMQCRRPGFDPGVRKISWRRAWQPTPVFLPGEFHGQRGLAGYSPLDHKESETTERKRLSHTRTS